MPDTDSDFNITFDLDLKDNTILKEEINIIESNLNNILKRFIIELDEGD